MAETLKILGQASLTANTLTDIYTVSAGTQTVISTITICNRSNVFGSYFRLSVAKNGEGDNIKQYLYYDVPITPNETFATTIGLSLNVGDIIRGYADTANLSFNIFGQEIT